MEQTNGYLAAINVLGGKIISLEEELRFARIVSENRENELKTTQNALAEANAAIEHLNKKLEAVREYTERMER